MYSIKTAKKKKSSLLVMARRPIDSPQDRNQVPYRLQCIRQSGNKKEEEMSISKLLPATQISQPLLPANVSAEEGRFDPIHADQ